MLIAAAGLAGSGKTTALGFLAEMGFGEVLYIGGIVRDEVAGRGLLLNPANEKRVRKELRDDRGMTALAEIAEPRIRSALNRGKAVLIDAICCVEEADFYRSAFADRVFILGLDAAFSTRVARLTARQSRPMTEIQLADRDAFERQELLIDRVLIDADELLHNEGTLQNLRAELEALVSPRLRDAMLGAPVDRAESD